MRFTRMRLRNTITKLVMILALILSFITQPTLAASLSTSMQIAASFAQTSKVLSVAQDQNVIECPHTMMDTDNMSLEQTEKSNAQPHKDCLATCQFCMSVAFILPFSLNISPHKEAQIVHVSHVQKPISIHYLPAYEPPRLAS